MIPKYRQVIETLPVTSCAWRMIARRCAAARASSFSVTDPPSPRRTRCVHDVRQFQIAEDLGFAPAIADVVNRAYAHSETGLFATKIDRTDVNDVVASISRRETAVALLDGTVVGSVRAHAFDDRTGWFGALGVEPAVHGRGFGEALVGFVEDEAAAASRAEMQLEVFESETRASAPVANPSVARATWVPRDVPTCLSRRYTRRTRRGSSLRPWMLSP